MTRTPPVTFEPEYGPTVTRVLPGIVGLMALCGAFFLWAHLSAPDPGVLAMALASFGVGLAFPGLYFYYLVYRRIVFTEDRIRVERWLFPDREAGYGEAGGVDAMGFRLDGFPVTCHTMANADEFRSLLDDLRAAGYLEGAAGGGLSGAFRANLAATLKAAVLGGALWLLVEGTGLAPASVPDALLAWGIVAATLVVAAPLFRRRNEPDGA